MVCDCRNAKKVASGAFKKKAEKALKEEAKNWVLGRNSSLNRCREARCCPRAAAEAAVAATAGGAAAVATLVTAATP